MDSIKALEKLRESSRLDDCKWMLGNGEIVFMVNAEPNDPRAVNWGEQWRKIADEIESEIAERFIEMPVDADGVPIRPGDVMEFKRGNLQRDGAVVLVGKELVSFGDAFSYHADDCRHVQPDTVESLLEEFGRILVPENAQDGLPEFVERYADRIRKVVEQ